MVRKSLTLLELISRKWVGLFVISVNAVAAFRKLSRGRGLGASPAHQGTNLESGKITRVCVVDQSHPLLNSARILEDRSVDASDLETMSCQPLI